MKRVSGSAGTFGRRCHATGCAWRKNRASSCCYNGSLCCIGDARVPEASAARERAEFAASARKRPVSRFEQVRANACVKSKTHGPEDSYSVSLETSSVRTAEIEGFAENARSRRTILSLMRYKRRQSAGQRICPSVARRDGLFVSRKRGRRSNGNRLRNRESQSFNQEAYEDVKSIRLRDHGSAAGNARAYLPLIGCRKRTADSKKEGGQHIVARPQATMTRSLNRDCVPNGIRIVATCLAAD